MGKTRAAYRRRPPLLVRALRAAQAQKAVGEDAAFEKSIALVFDKVGQARPGLSLDSC
jgi:hypothetical protein